MRRSFSLGFRIVATNVPTLTPIKKLLTVVSIILDSVMPTLLLKNEGTSASICKARSFHKASDTRREEFLLNIENIFLFRFCRLIDLGDMRVGGLLDILQCTALFVLADQLVLE